MTAEQYEALLNWARLGASENDETVAFLALRRALDDANAIRRYALVIRYTPLPELPWLGISPTPQGKVRVLEMARPPTPEDVLEALRDEAISLGVPHHIYVTADPAGVVGWYEFERFPWSG